MKLTDRQIKNAKEPKKMGDQGGLFLQVTDNGFKLWRHKYHIAGKQKLLALGKYPDVSREAH